MFNIFNLFFSGHYFPWKKRVAEKLDFLKKFFGEKKPPTTNVSPDIEPPVNMRNLTRQEGKKNSFFLFIFFFSMK